MIVLLTIALIVAILFAGLALYQLVKHPPVVTINIVTPAVAAANKAAEAAPPPMPENIIEYTDEESDDWAREARKRRARSLYTELGNWDAVLRQLQREDALPE